MREDRSHPKLTIGIYFQGGRLIEETATSGMTELMLASGLTLWNAEPKRLDLEFDVTNVSNSIYQIAKESEEIPIQYAPPRTVGGSLKLRF